MVVGVFPGLKLGVLFVRQISKPLAKYLIEQAKNHPVFRSYIIIPPAQFYNWAEVKARMYLMNLGKPTKVQKLSEDMAIELGANLMGEVIIFSIAGGCLLFEYSRQQSKEARKEQLRQQQIEKFTSDIQALYENVVKQENEIKFLNTVVEELNKKTKVKLPLKQNIINTLDDSNKSKDIQIDDKTTLNKVNNRDTIIDQAIALCEKDIKGDKPS